MSRRALPRNRKSYQSYVPEMPSEFYWTSMESSVVALREPRLDCTSRMHSWCGVVGCRHCLDIRYSNHFRWNIWKTVDRLCAIRQMPHRTAVKNAWQPMGR